MREKQIEQQLVRKIKQKGGLALKLTSPTLDGLPDRLILMPHGKVAFVEVKASGKHLRPLQLKRKRQLEELGFSVFVLCGMEQLEDVIKQIVMLNSGGENNEIHTT